ncbi:MAG: LLM class flavin-dependent oxidoreductase, partial [Thermoplasmata archaeon]
SFSFIEPSEAKAWVDDYYSTICSEACVPAGFALNANLAVVMPFMCHRDEEEALRRGLDGGHFFGYSLGHYYAFGSHRPGQTNVWEEFCANRSLFGFDRDVASRTGEPLGAKLMEEGLGSLRGAIGTPDQIRQLLSSYAEAGVDQVIFVSQAGRNRHEDICESMELFAAEVLDDVHSGEDQRERAKAERLAPAIEAALDRREPPREPPDYSFDAAAAV